MNQDERTAVLARIGIDPWQAWPDGLLEYDHVHDEWRVEVQARPPATGKRVIRRYAGRKRWPSYLGWGGRRYESASPLDPRMRVFPRRNRRSTVAADAEIEAWMTQMSRLDPVQHRAASVHRDPNYIGEPEPPLDHDQYLRDLRQVYADMGEAKTRSLYEQRPAPDRATEPSLDPLARRSGRDPGRPAAASHRA